MRFPLAARCASLVGTERAQGPNRRAFVTAFAGACAGGAALLSGCATVATYRVTAPPREGRVTVPRAEFERLALERGAIRVESAALPEPVLLLAAGDADGGFRAIGSTCTHQQCAVRPGRTFLRCACHGSTFDLEGAVVRGPASKPLPRYDVTADANDIHIRMPPPAPEDGG